MAQIAPPYKWLIGLFLILISLAFSSPDPSAMIFAPFFVDPTPQDTTVNCIGDIPMPVDLTADDGAGTLFEVTSVDTPDALMIDPCTGGIITRTWTAIAGAEMISVTQQITILADNLAPVVSLAMISDTVTCELALPSAPNNPDRYDVWISSVQVGVSTNTADNCAGAINIMHDGGDPFEDPCTTRTVTFDVSDQCGNMTQYVAMYTSIDTVAPVLIGLPPNDTISCADMIPDTAIVTVMDNCTPNLVATFSEVNFQTSTGLCTDYTYNIRRVWTVSDSCGNVTEHTQIISVEDDTPPSFTTPADLTISCTSDPNDLSITGNVTDAMDNCSAVTITFNDQIIPGLCEDEMTIKRFWQVTDACANSSNDIQIINVADLLPPTFVAPPDIVVDCSQADDLAVTGVPTNIMDDCTPDPDVDFTDDFFLTPCSNNYTIRRRWSVTDRCGQATIITQEITVVDQQAPSFVAMPQSMSISCALGQDVQTIFNDWVNNRAQATATDNCSLSADITWTAFNSGTMNAPSLDVLACPVVDDVIMRQDVDFIITDECGLKDTATVSFTVLDQTAPVLSECPTDKTVATDPGLCSATVILSPPVITDECSNQTTMVSATDMAMLTTQAPMGEEGEFAVDPVDLSLILGASLPLNANTTGTLVISLTSVDAETAGEFFNVYGEDGTLIGQTDNTAVACGDGQTTLTLSVAQINSWGVDGIINLRLEPNIPTGQPERFAINAICPNPSFVQADLSFLADDLNGIVYQYSIDGGNRVTVPGIQDVSVNLDLGSHLIWYFAKDCASNIDSCSFTIDVVDQEAPVLNCPAPIIVSVDADSCQKTITLPMPLGAMDNCQVLGMYERTLPATPNEALLNFFLDPNLNDYLPAGRILSFDDVNANVNGDVTLTIDLQGDFNTNGAFFTILGDDGNSLGQSNIGVANCATAGQKIITIPAATFNTWAADGIVNIEIIPNDITVPPGVLGDGINPCDPMAVNADGDDDGISFITATISYNNLQSSYYMTGVTPAPLALFPESGVLAPTFNVGLTEVFYLTQDVAGNADTCSFDVLVQDVTPPTVLCSPTNLFINPSGAQVEVVNAIDVDAGSFDNCGVIDSFWLTPNTFECDIIGQIVNVTLSAVDTSGNIGTCQTIVGIAADGPMPTANSGLCGGDTLFLIANPPGPSVGTYLYQWFSPSGAPLSAQSSEPDLMIVGIDAADQGPYKVVITGLSGCTAEGVVNVNIEDLPLTPELQIPPSICADANLLLETPLIPAGTGVQFYWYEGIAPNGTLIGTSVEPMFLFNGPFTTGVHNFYMEVEANSCLSPPSEMQSLIVYNRPIATVDFTDSLVCAGEVITLGAANQSGAQYSWTGPNSYNDNIQFPNTNALETSDGGFYFVRLNRGECVSEPDSTLVTVKPRPDAPNISTNAPICSGEELILNSTVNGMSVYEWESPSAQVFSTNSPSFGISNATEDERGTWRLRVTSNDCVSAFSEAVSVIINTTPTVSANANPNPACQGDDVLLQGVSNVAGSSFEWTGPNEYLSGIQTPTLANISQARAGIYKVVVTTTPGCIDSTEVQVAVFESVNITGLSDNIPACVDEGFDVLLSSSTMPSDDGSYTYSWRLNGMEVSTLPNLSIPNATSEDDGTYSLEVTTGDGCSSGQESITVDLNFLPPQPSIPMTVSGNLSFCEGESMTLITSAISGMGVEYFWETPAGTIVTNENMLVVNNLNAGDDGGYRVYAVRQGCESSTSPSRDITIHLIPTLGINSNSPVCEGDDITLQTTFYPTGIYTWSGPAAFESTVFNPIVHNADPDLHTGTYRVFVDNFGCLSDTVSIMVEVRNRPTTPLVDHDAAICLDDEQSVLTLSIDTMSSVSGASYIWYTNNGSTTISDPTPELIYELIDFSIFEDGGPFPFYAQATVNGCLSSLSTPTIVQFDTIPINMSFAGRDTTVCSGEYILDGATPTVGLGVWSLVTAVDPTGFSITNPDDAQSIVSGLSSSGAPYTLQWTLSNGACRDYSSDLLELDVINAEIATIGPDILVCEDEAVFLDAVPASEDAQGFWSQDNTQISLGVTIVDPSNPNTEINGLSSDNIYFFQWNVVSVCGTTDSTIIVNISDPGINAGTDIIVCDLINEITLQGEAASAGSSATWHSPDASLEIIDASSPTAMIRNLKLGENILIWEVDGGFCGEISRDTMSVFYKHPPVLEDDAVSVPFGMPVDLLPLDNDQVPPGTIIQINVPAQEGSVEVSEGILLTYTPPANFVGIDELTYASVSEGCPEETAIVQFIIGEGAACKIPSIFTPNGDGYNDKFVIPCLLNTTAYPKSQVTIFNRWGDEVFRSNTPYQSDWGGTYSGEDLPDDTYFYVVDLGDGSDPMSGYLMIQR